MLLQIVQTSSFMDYTAEIAHMWLNFAILHNANNLFMSWLGFVFKGCRSVFFPPYFSKIGRSTAVVSIYFYKNIHISLVHPGPQLSISRNQSYSLCFCLCLFKITHFYLYTHLYLYLC